MASFTCPQCKRFVDETMRSCPGCKFNIKKYVKEMKKNGMSFGGLSLNSVYNRSAESAPVSPQLDFLKPAAPEPATPAAPEYSAPAAPAYSAPAPEPAPAYSAPAAPAPAPSYSAPSYPTQPPVYNAPTPQPAYQTPGAAAAPAPAYPTSGASAPAAPAPEPAPAYSAPAPAAPEVVFESPSLNRKPDEPKFVAPKYEKPINQQAGANVGNRSNSSTPWSAAPAATPVDQGAVSGPFESAILNSTTVGTGGGALSGMFSKPTVMEQIRAEKEKERAEASIFDSPTLRAQEKAINSGAQAPLGGLHGNMSIAEFMEQQKLTNSYNNRRNYTAAPDAPQQQEAPAGPAQISDKPTYEELARAYGGAAAQTQAPANPYLQQQVLGTTRPSGPYNGGNNNPFLSQTTPTPARTQTSGTYAPQANNNPFLSQQPAAPAPTTSGPYRQQPNANPMLGSNNNPMLGGGA
ncbi:MAG: hypothetical protein K5686_09860 [Lachnospiraceae bacterium]|nr:hypothetical protein [Lachnospiraceae bacterium]